MAWIILLILLLIGLGLMLYRAIQFKPRGDLGLGAPRACPVPEMPVAMKLSELVQLPTISWRDKDQEDRQAFLDFRDKLQQLYPNVAAHCHRLLVGDNGIVYCWRGQGSEDPRVLMSHYDVVPVQAEGWSRPPFSGDVAEGFVHGRGTLDTKCTLAALMEAAEQLIGRGFVPQQDIYLCFAGDEETMGPTAQLIIDALAEAGVTPGFVLDEGGGITEQTLPGLKLPAALVGSCEKGMSELVITATAKAGHASAPPRHTALGVLSKAIRRVENRPWPLHYTPPVMGMFDTLGRHASLPWRMVYANLQPLRPLLSLYTAMVGGDISAMLRTTCAFTMANGSDASNVLPSQARGLANMRVLPGESSKTVRRRAQRLLRSKRLDVQVRPVSEPSPVSRTDDNKWAALVDAINEVWPEALVSPYLMTACTDSRHYSRISEHVYRFSGIQVGKQERSLIHAQDERISLGSLAKCQAFYEALMIRL